MATVSDYLTQLQSDKQTLVDNLVAKGVDATSDETFTSLVPKVADIQSGSGIDEYMSGTISKGQTTTHGYYSGWVLSILKCREPLTIEGTNADYMFYNFPLSTTPKLTSTTGVTSMQNMFSTSYYIVKPNLENFDTSSVTNMASMFYGLPNATSIDLSSFDTSNVTNMSKMFQNCSDLTSLDLSSFDTSNVTDMSKMFYSCKALIHLDIRNFDFTNVTSYSSMFNNIPTDCEIIVKDDTAKTWITEKFTTLTNVKTVAELEGTE